MSHTQKSAGPQDVRISNAGKWAVFGTEIVNAEGDWVEIELTDDETRNAAGYASVYARIGRERAEVVKRDDIMYGRMKES